jgi:hypothetical protein
MSRWKALPLVAVSLLWIVGCDSFDDDSAAVQIRQAFCEGWPYGCTDNTVVEVGKVRETRYGRQVEFRVVDGEDRTGTLKAAYFEEKDGEWAFLLFEPPFSERFAREKSRVVDDQREFEEQLMDLKAAQKWFNTIYGRFARSLAELDSVSYEPPGTPLEMTVGPEGNSWSGVVKSQYARCILEVPRRQLPSCQGLAALNTGTPSGPLTTAFGEEE